MAWFPKCFKIVDISTIRRHILRKYKDLNLRAGMNRFGGFRDRCITTLPTLKNINRYTEKSDKSKKGNRKNVNNSENA